MELICDSKKLAILLDSTFHEAISEKDLPRDCRDEHPVLPKKPSLVLDDTFYGVTLGRYLAGDCKGDVPQFSKYTRI